MENATIDKLSTMPLVSYDKAYQYILSLKYNDSERILFLEQQLYNLLQQTPNDVNLLVLLLHEQIMNNKGQRARSIAHKIWENGGELAPEAEKMYIDDLINLCLLDMAGAALMPIISDLEHNVDIWSDILLKYALVSGNMSLLGKILNYLPENNPTDILVDWIALCDYMQATNHMPKIMTRICDKLQDTMLGFSYNLFFDRGFPDIEFVFYVGNEVHNFEDLRDTLHLQISSYCAAHKIDDLVNLSCAIRPISQR